MTTEIHLRRALGILGMILPLANIGFGFLFCRYAMGLEVPISYFDSISATHYASSSLLFEGVVFAVGCFLITYRGYDIADYWISTVTGIMGLLLTLFPTAVEGIPAFNFCGIDSSITRWIHNITAIAFFLGLAFMEIWQFTKTNTDTPTPEKKKRNVLYRVCGIGMLVAVFLGGAVDFLFHLPFSTYIGEGIGLEFFGIAWLVKGQTLLKDKC